MTKKRKFFKTRLEKILLILLILMFALEVVFVAQPEGYAAVMRVLLRRPASEDGVLWMLPNKLSPRLEDETLTVQIRAAKVKDLYGIQFDVKYNPEVLEYVGITEDDYLGTGEVDTFWSIPDSGTSGVLRNIAGTRLNMPGSEEENVGVDANGYLLLIDFKLKKPGRANLKIENVLTANSEGEEGQNYLAIPLNLRVRN